MKRRTFLRNTTAASVGAAFTGGIQVATAQNMGDKEKRYQNGRSPWPICLDTATIRTAGLLKDGKGTTWEGGMRIPGIFWMPGSVKPKVVTDIGSTLDLFTTVSSMAHIELPKDRALDGTDLSPVLFEGKEQGREGLIYYRGQKIYAARKGAFKLHYITQTAYVKDTKKTLYEEPLLFNLEIDPEERFNIAKEHPEIIIEIENMVKAHKASVKPVKDQLAERVK